MALREGLGPPPPQQTFVRWNDPYGTELIGINRDGTIYSFGFRLPDGATIDAAGNIIDPTGSLTLGNFSGLPDYSYLESILYAPFKNSISVGAVAPAGITAFQVTLDAEVGSNYATAIVGTSLASGTNVGILSTAIVKSGTDGGNCTAFFGSSFNQDNTVTHSFLLGIDAEVFNSEGQADFAAGVYTYAQGGTGNLKSVGVNVNGVFSDTSIGTAIGLWIEPDNIPGLTGISGATRYAIKSDTTAPSTFAGSISLPQLILSTPQTPNYIY
jgi:hypothetical protein